MLTVNEVADALRVTPQHVRDLIREGRIKAVHVSPRVTRIPASELDRLMTGDAA